MPNQGNAKTIFETQADQILAQKVKVPQKRVRKMGILSDGSDD